MTRFIVRRLIYFVITFLVVLAGSFILMHAAPGNPFTDEKPPSAEVLAARNALYHLDLPIVFNAAEAKKGALWRSVTRTQLGCYAAGLFRGDLGPTYRYKDMSVNEVLFPSIPVSMLLGAIGLCFAVLIGLPAGVIAAARHNRWLDRAAITAAMGGVILPNFILGPLLVMIFAFELHLLPPAGWGRPADLVLPSFLIGLPVAAMIARLVRSGLIEELSRDYVRAARARGVPEFKVVMKHALKNAILPVVSYLGPAAAGVMTGTVVVETIFAIPGMGTHFVHGAMNRDYKLVMGAVLVYCVVLMTFNLIVDVVYRLLDPRVEVS